MSGGFGKYLRGGDGNTTAGGSPGGGGSGYYGGGGGADLSGGGGGSSYASYEMYNVILLGGNKYFPSPNDDVKKGNRGNRAIKIELSNPYTIDRTEKDCNKSESLNTLTSQNSFSFSFFFVLNH